MKAKHARALARAPQVPTFKRGLYEVANLACMLESLGYCHNAAEYEAALEGDNSPVPGMLGEALKAFGEALIAMAEEEVQELLAAHEDDADEEEEMERALAPSARAFIAEGKTAQIRAWRRGIAVVRAGKALSVSNQKKLEEADGHHERAMKHHRAMADQHEALGGHIDAAQDGHERMTQTLAELGEHVRSAQAAKDPREHLDAAEKAHRAAEKQAADVADAHDKADDAHEDVGDSHQSLGRSVQRARRCVRSVLAGAVSSEADEPNADALVQKEAAAKAERAQKAREARAARARELAKQHKEPITLD